MIQRPVADLCIQGDALSVLKNLGKIERPQYSCNFMKCVKRSVKLQRWHKKHKQKNCASGSD